MTDSDGRRRHQGQRRCHRIVVLAAASAFLVGCVAAAPRTEPPGPRFERISCPDDVEIQVVPSHDCGEVVLPQPSGPDLRVFVVSVDPPSPSSREPVLETGTDAGMTPAYSGLAPIAQRTGRRLVIVDLPGTGHSSPSLDCLEVDALRGVVPAQDQDALVGAVTACRERLAEQGVDVAEFTVARSGEALHAVAVALEVPQWVAMGHGTTGSAALRWAGSHPEEVAALVLDSVALDGGLDTTLERIVADLAVVCRADPACSARHGDLQERWTAASERLGAQPTVVPVEGGVVTVDSAGLARAARWLLAPAEFGASRLPELLTEVERGEAGQLLSSYAATVMAAPPLCVGELPKCTTTEQASMGAVLSNLCPSVADEPPWRRPCEAWGVPAADEDPEPVVGTPALVLSGRYDPFAASDVARAMVDALIPDAFVVEDPAGGHNVLAGECMRELRNLWLSGDLTAPPTSPCLSERRLGFSS